MHKLILILSSIFILLFSLESCRKESGGNDPKEPSIAGSRLITFAGYQWEVKSSSEKNVGPGPNLFADTEQNVWVDKIGKLHLRITHRNGKWYCAGVTLLKSFAYAKYIFELDIKVDTLDKNVVNGLFLYENDNEETDIEFSQWGVTDKRNAQFAIQPGDKAGNKQRFSLSNTGNQSVHWIDWHPDEINFASYKGLLSDTSNTDNIIQQWTYNGSDIPTNGDETVKMNLWLFKGNPPSNNKETEVVISGFKIIELDN